MSCFRWRMNCLVPSKLIGISNTGGLVARRTSSKRWLLKSWGTRHVLSFPGSFHLLEISLCISPLAFSLPVESLPVEEALPDLQLLLRSKDRCPYCHVCLLLCCFASYSLGSRSISTKMGCCIYSFYDHPPKRSWNSKVMFLPFCFSMSA